MEKSLNHKTPLAKCQPTSLRFNVFALRSQGKTTNRTNYSTEEKVLVPQY